MDKHQLADKNQVIVIHNRDDLEELPRKQYSLFARPKSINVSIELLGPDSKNRTSYEQRLSRYYSDCGCSWGAAAGLIFIAGYLITIVIAFFTGKLFRIGWNLIPVGLLLFFLWAALGKMIGLTLAKIRIRRTILDINKELCEQ